MRGASRTPATLGAWIAGRDARCIREVRLRRSRIVDPLTLVLALVFTALVILASNPSRRIATALLIVTFLGSALLSAVNALVLLFLLPPFFNGDDWRPYFFLQESFVAITLVAGFGAIVWRRSVPRVPAAPFVVAFFLSTVLSLPLNLRETWIELSRSSRSELLEAFRSGDLEGNMFYVRSVVNVLTGAGLYILAANVSWNRQALLRVATAATVVYLTVTGLGLGLYHAAPASPDTFLSLRIGGDQINGFTGLGFNPAYFAEYTIAYVPLAGLLLVRGTLVTRAAGALTLLLSGYAMILTYQRAAYLVFVAELCVLGASLSRVALHQVRRRAVTLTLAGVGGLAGAMLFVSPVGRNVSSRFLELWHHGDHVRTHVLEVTWTMFRDQPLFGVGSGRFAHLFRFYSPEPGLQFGSWSAHNLYAQLLAEQGLFGLASFLALVLMTAGAALRRASQSTERRPETLVLLVSLGSWLAYGMFHDMLLLRSMQIYFWILLGVLVSLAPDSILRVGWRRPLVLTAGALLVIAAAVRAHGASRRPLPVDYAWGFHEAGVQIPADRGANARWTRRVAFMHLRVQDRVLRLSMLSPIPQRVSIGVDDSPPLRLVLGDSRWETVDIPVQKAPGSTVLVQIHVGLTFVPAARGFNRDARRLGVLVESPRWVDASPAASPPLARQP
jgi:O-antigen ligase